MSFVKVHLDTGTVNCHIGVTDQTIHDPALAQAINEVAMLRFNETPQCFEADCDVEVLEKLFDYYLQQLLEDQQRFFEGFRDSSSLMEEFIELQIETKGREPLKQHDLVVLRDGIVDLNWQPLDPMHEWINVLNALQHQQISVEEAGVLLIKLEQILAPRQLFKPFVIHTSAIEDQFEFIQENKALMDFFSPVGESMPGIIHFIDLKQRIENLSVSGDVVQAFKDQDYKHAVFSETDWDLLLIKALVDGAISVEEALPLLLYRECQKNYPDVTPVCLLKEDGSIHEEAFEVLCEHLRYRSDMPGATSETMTGEKKPLLDAAAKERFKQELAKLPKSQAQFFLLNHPYPMPFPEPPGPDERRVITKIITNDILGASNANFTADDPVTLAVLPLHLHNLMCQARFGENAVASRPVTGGLSSYERFYATDARDVFIPCHWLLTPPDVHSLPTDGLGIYLHDAYYHVIVASSYPLKVRKLYVSILRNMPNLKQQTIEDILDLNNAKRLISEVNGEPIPIGEYFIEDIFAIFEKNKENIPDLARVLIDHKEQIRDATDGIITIERLKKTSHEPFSWRWTLSKALTALDV